jgi:hypothetical protein
MLELCKDKENRKIEDFKAEMLKEAKEYEKKEDWERAAEKYEEAGKPKEALDIIKNTKDVDLIRQYRILYERTIDNEDFPTY